MRRTSSTPGTHSDHHDHAGTGVSPGKRTLTEQLGRAAGSSGAPLREDVRERFEASLGADLSAVRVHTGAESAESAAGAQAKAYTVGNDIHFAAGQYQPDDAFGLHLLAHEVAHTQQQAGGAARAQYKLEVGGEDGGAEAEADRAADAMVAGTFFTMGTTAGVGMQRKAEKTHDDVPEHVAPTPPSPAAREEARGYYTSMRDQFNAQIRRIDAEVAELEKVPPAASPMGFEQDLKVRDERKRALAAEREEYAKVNEAIAKNLALLDDVKPESQIRAVDRANAAKTTYTTTTTTPGGVLNVLTGGSTKQTITTVEEEATATGGPSKTTTRKQTSESSMKDGSRTTGESVAVTTTNGGQSTTVTTGDKTTVGVSGLSRTSESSTVTDGKIEKTTVTGGIKRENGRVGSETTYQAQSGTANDEGGLKKGTSVTGTANAGVTVGPDNVTVDGGGKLGGTMQANEQTSLGVTTGVQGKVTLTIIKDASGQCWASLSFSLQVSAGVLGKLGKQGVPGQSAGLSGGAEVRHGVQKTLQIPLSESEVAGYQAEFTKAAAGGTAAGPGLLHVQTLKQHGDDAAFAALSGSTSEDARAAGMGYEQTTTNGATIEGGANAAVPDGQGMGGGFTVKYSKDNKVTFGHRPKVGAPDVLVVRIVVRTDSAITGGITANAGSASGNAGVTDKDAAGKTYVFEMANRPELVAELEELTTEAEVKAFVQRAGTKLLEEGTLTGDGGGYNAGVAVGGVGANMAWSGDGSVNEIRDENGKIIRTEVSGSNTVSGGVTVPGATVVSRTDTEKLSGSVTADGKVDMTLENSTATSAVSPDKVIHGMAENPVGTAIGLASLSADTFTATETTTTATKVGNKEIEYLKTLARKGGNAWTKACNDPKAMDAWLALGKAIRAAEDDDAAIAKAMAAFTNSSEPGREAVISNALASSTDVDVGTRAQWPPSVASFRADYERVTAPKFIDTAVIAVYRSSGLQKALDAIATQQVTVSHVRNALSMNEADFTDKAALMEMNRLLSRVAGDLNYLKKDLPEQHKKFQRQKQQQAHDDHVDMQLRHGVDWEQQQSFKPIVEPEESVPCETVMSPPPEVAPAEPAPTPEEEKKRRKDLAWERLRPLAESVDAYRRAEEEVFAWVRGELAKKEKTFSFGPDYAAVFTKLNDLKAGYAQWDAVIKQMKDIIAGAGSNPANADKKAPNRGTWNALNSEATSAYG